MNAPPRNAGDVLPERTYGPLTRTDFVRYQGASGDFNPIHHDDEYARSAGFPSVFSVGMLQAGILATYVTSAFGAENIRRFSVQFREQVWPGDVLVCRGSITDITETGGERRATIAIELSRAGGGVAVRGEAAAVIA